jgi:alkylation response protein AidB-like acyl-CoA dehydrogenase
MRFRFDAPRLPAAAAPLRREVRAFLAAERAAGRIGTRANSWMAYDAGFTRRCGEAGYIGITFPREYGGHGRSAMERYVVCEEMLAAGAPIGMHWVADRQSGPQILRHGSEAARRRVIPEIVAGRCCIGIGMSEPNAGSDLAAVKTRATRVEGGWRISGAKLWTSNAHRAQYIILLARSEPAGENRHAGLTQFLVDAAAPGLRANPITDLSGSRDFNEVALEDVFVPDDYVLGKPGDGWKLVTGELAYERSGPERFLSTLPVVTELAARLGAQAPASARAALGRLVAHLATLRRMSLAIAGMLDKGESPQVQAALVKDLGNAYEREVPEIARLLVDCAPEKASAELFSALLGQSILAAPSFTLRGGTREILRGIVARELGLR